LIDIDMTSFALLLFPDMTQLDLTGPYEVFSRCPGAQVHVAWKTVGPVKTEHGLALQATTALAELAQVDVLCIPGGFGVDALLDDDELLQHVRRLAAGARFVTSVCSGALVLGAAGLLRGRRATTHWTSLDLLARFGATPVADRIVVDGSVITGGGVTAGIDFGLHLAALLHGRPIAEAIQLGIEYRPAPPFDAGHPDVAAASVIDRVRARSAPRRAGRVAAVDRAARRLMVADSHS
jgi:cyclohexyl-isocyanide hydratase